jgi:hypothetical protein
MKKFVKILGDIINEQLVEGFEFAVDPKTGKELSDPFKNDYAIDYRSGNQPVKIKVGGSMEDEPLPPLESLTDPAVDCLNNVLSQPQFKGKWSNIWGYADRYVAGSKIKSEHSYGNALDYVAKGGDLDPTMQKLADYLVDNASELKVKNVIYNYKIWNSPKGWHDYDTSGGKSAHTDHVHVDFIK